MTDLPALSAGYTLKLKMKAFNVAGKSVTSKVVSTIVADVPSTPTSGPVSVGTITSADKIKITYTAPSSGGSLITNYEVQMDDGLGSGFITVAGGTSSNLITTYFSASTSGTRFLSIYEPELLDDFYLSITRGHTYMFRFRA